MLHVLLPHPDSPPVAGLRVAAGAARGKAGGIALEYVVTGNIAGLLLPPPATPARADELWCHTCLEAFVAAPPSEAYAELNFAPSAAWAAYRFEGYRAGMRNADISPPRIEIERAVEKLAMRVSVAAGAFADFPADAAWRLGLAAVIEAIDGAKSYWALAHGAGKPDFHRADCFTLQLPPASRT